MLLLLLLLPVAAAATCCCCCCYLSLLLPLFLLLLLRIFHAGGSAFGSYSCFYKAVFFWSYLQVDERSRMANAKQNLGLFPMRSKSEASHFDQIGFSAV